MLLSVNYGHTVCDLYIPKDSRTKNSSKYILKKPFQLITVKLQHVATSNIDHEIA